MVSVLLNYWLDTLAKLDSIWIYKMMEEICAYFLSFSNTPNQIRTSLLLLSSVKINEKQVPRCIDFISLLCNKEDNVQWKST